MWIHPKTDWTGEDYYNFKVLNRVENNTEYLKELLNILGHNIDIDTMSNRDIKHIEFAESLNRIESNINKLKIYPILNWIPVKTDWQDNDPFSYKDANRLENNLLHLYYFTQSNVNNFKYCGTYICGEEMI